ncbi:MAG: oxidoreductase [Hyphomicrobiales bacterium]|nr:oxidoreductase [Hyphomicrobiales bacterium]
MSQLRVPVGPTDHIRGNLAAAVTLVEYGDYQCPHCAMAHPVVASIRQQLGPNLCFVFRHFPLTEIHPFAEPAAESAEFAGEHGRFWDMHDGLFENHDNLALPTLLDLARLLDLPRAELQDVLATEKYQPAIQSDFIGGVRSGVNGTPAFFINGVRHDGSYAYKDLMISIQAALAR